MRNVGLFWYLISAILGRSTVRSLSLAATLFSMSAGCAMSTWVSESDGYPRDVDSDKTQYQMTVWREGAAGHRYIDRTEKTVLITITSGEHELMRREYRMVAADLGYSAKWNRAEEVEVVLFDLPEGVTIYDRREAKQCVPRNIMTLRYSMDAKTGLFTEAPLPWDQIDERRRPK